MWEYSGFGRHHVKQEEWNGEAQDDCATKVRVHGWGLGVLVFQRFTQGVFGARGGCHLFSGRRGQCVLKQFAQTFAVIQSAARV